ncbi:general stress protein [Cohnella sp. REN36]|uniref:general stress protein n=1 Tax=Cohnella sp. REN36 TaxID=2887347 RepID=UPI001D1599DB|nr:general stress protein [Cohnella sp. REN36]MCC3375782.1 general stress protein [Cohnella sp. REN36]
MGMTIGIFNQEQQVIDAIEMLRSAGAHKEDLRVIVKSESDAPLLSSNSDVPVEGVAGVREARERVAREDEGSWTGDEGVLPVAGVAAAPQMTGTAGYPGSGPLVPVVGLFDWDGGEAPDSERVLSDMGLPDGAADRVAEELVGGKYVLVAEERPDGQTERILRQAGAIDTLH